MSQDGAPQANLDVDANRLVLLDRVENDELESNEDTAVLARSAHDKQRRRASAKSAFSVGQCRRLLLLRCLAAAPALAREARNAEPPQPQRMLHTLGGAAG